MIRLRLPRPGTRRAVQLAALPGLALALVLPGSRAAAQVSSQAPADAAVRVAELFEEWDTSSTPGCAVGVAEHGLTVFADAWGMADLEWGVPATHRTIYENGSVSKQFTAAAVVLLALEGRLSLDDDIRDHIPEVPDYGPTITITHLMNHTSGLRDWGSVAGMSGWGRSDRTHDHDWVLDIISRQSALNFEPGHEYSYSNSGYNLLAILVERVSGMPFAEYSKERIFEPVGMVDTQWRDDYRRIVPGRAAAYARSGDGFRIDRPIEQVHGNGGLLTTVHDLLAWNESLSDALFGEEFVRLMQENGVLNDGRSITYARGLSVGETRGVPSVTHTGATSGYRAYLGRFPEQHLSVALLCNVANVNPGGLGAQIADVYLDGIMEDPVLAVAAVAVPEPELARWEGLWVEDQTGQPTQVEVRDEALHWGGTPLHPMSAGGDRFAIGTSGRTLSLADDAAVERDGDVEVDRYHRVEPVAASDFTVAELQALAGTYHSDDAEMSLEVVVDEYGLGMVRRPGRRIGVRPSYADAFASPLGLVRFLRDESGAVTGLTIYQSRVYDMRFDRIR
ncbi:MAG: beta-lactamase family protein [Gemmatimonadetes bacterium]|nr:beta-lactamase family protein [Gemmatimonadota bacterium]